CPRPRVVQVGWPLLAPRIPMIATLTMSFGPGRAWLRFGNERAIPAVAANVFAMKRRRFMASLLIVTFAATLSDSETRLTDGRRLLGSTHRLQHAGVMNVTGT